MSRFQRGLFPVAADIALALGPALEPRPELFYAFADRDLPPCLELDNLCRFVLERARANARVSGEIMEYNGVGEVGRASGAKACEDGLVALAWSRMLARSDCDARLRGLVVDWVQGLQ